MPMTQEQLAYLLSRIDLFESFTPFTLRLVAQACRCIELAAGELLFAHGSTGSELFIVVGGALEVFRGDRVIARVERNQYIGELALLDPAVRSASVRATSPTTLLEVGREVFERYLQSEPDSLTAMMRTVTRRLRGMIDDTQMAYEAVNMQVHDMLNILNVLAGAEFVAEALPPGDEHHRYLEMILHTRDRLEVMMREVLRKAGGRSVAYARVPSDVEALARQCLESDLALHPDVRRVQTGLRVEGVLVPCVCNPVDLQRVVANLVINAAQAAGPGARVTIRVRQAEGRTLLEVEDNGPGIDAEVLPRIFENHFTTKANGTGLGLSSCRLIVEDLHGGHITCRSRPGQGTAFTVDIPTELSH